MQWLCGLRHPRPKGGIKNDVQERKPAPVVARAEAPAAAPALVELGVLEHLPDPVSLLTDDGEILVQNSASVAVWGRLPRGLPHAADFLLERLFEADPDLLQEVLQSLSEGRTWKGLLRVWLAAPSTAAARWTDHGGPAAGGPAPAPERTTPPRMPCAGAPLPPSVVTVSGWAAPAAPCLQPEWGSAALIDPDACACGDAAAATPASTGISSLVGSDATYRQHQPQAEAAGGSGLGLALAPSAHGSGRPLHGPSSLRVVSDADSSYLSAQHALHRSATATPAASALVAAGAPRWASSGQAPDLLVAPHHAGARPQPCAQQQHQQRWPQAAAPVGPSSSCPGASFEGTASPYGSVVYCAADAWQPDASAAPSPRGAAPSPTHERDWRQQQRQQQVQQQALLDALTTSAWSTLIRAPHARRPPRRAQSVLCIEPSAESSPALGRHLAGLSSRAPQLPSGSVGPRLSHPLARELLAQHALGGGGSGGGGGDGQQQAQVRGSASASNALRRADAVAEAEATWAALSAPPATGPHPHAPRARLSCEIHAPQFLLPSPKPQQLLSGPERCGGVLGAHPDSGRCARAFPPVFDFVATATTAPAAATAATAAAPTAAASTTTAAAAAAALTADAPIPAAVPQLPLPGPSLPAGSDPQGHAAQRPPSCAAPTALGAQLVGGGCPQASPESSAPGSRAGACSLAGSAGGSGVAVGSGAMGRILSIALVTVGGKSRRASARAVSTAHLMHLQQQPLPGTGTPSSSCARSASMSHDPASETPQRAFTGQRSGLDGSLSSAAASSCFCSTATDGFAVLSGPPGAALAPGPPAGHRSTGGGAESGAQQALLCCPEPLEQAPPAAAAEAHTAAGVQPTVGASAAALGSGRGPGAVGPSGGSRSSHGMAAAASSGARLCSVESVGALTCADHRHQRCGLSTILSVMSYEAAGQPPPHGSAGGVELGLGLGPGAEAPAGWAPTCAAGLYGRAYDTLSARMMDEDKTGEDAAAEEEEEEDAAGLCSDSGSYKLATSAAQLAAAAAADAAGAQPGRALFAAGRPGPPGSAGWGGDEGGAASGSTRPPSRLPLLMPLTMPSEDSRGLGLLAAKRASAGLQLGAAAPGAAAAAAAAGGAASPLPAVRTSPRRDDLACTDAAAARPEALQQERWHEVALVSFVHPQLQRRVILVTQSDVSSRIWAERQLARVMEAEHTLLESIFPHHVISHIAATVANDLDERGTPMAPHRRPQQQRDVAAAAGAADGASPRAGQAQDDWGGAAGAAGLPAIRGDTFLSLATSHSELTVLFCDIQGFTPMCSQMRPVVVMSFLNDLFSAFDGLLDEYGVYKVETIGDCYVAAGGLMRVDEETGAVTVRSDDVDPLHAYRTIQFAKALLRAASHVRLPATDQPVKLRVGIHSGPAMSGVTGTRMPRFCLFGDTMNVASRMESTGEAGAIHVSQATRDLVPGEAWEARGGMEVKGKGSMDTFLLRA